MTNFAPLYVDTSGPTPKVKLATTSDDMDGVRNVNPAGTVDGRDVQADGTAQDAHIAAAAPHSGHATTADVQTAQATADAAAAAAAAAQGDVDSHEAAAAPHSGHLAGAANGSSTGTAATGAEEVGLTAGVTAQTLNVRSLAGELGIEALLVGGSVRVRGAPKLWAPSRRSRSESYTRIRHRGRKTAGAVGDNAASGPDYLPANLIATHGSTDHLWPFMVYTGVDAHGIVHQYHAGLRGNFAQTSDVKGFEFGHPVQPGDARLGHSFVWLLEGAAENVTWDDAFWHFVVEINPQSGTFNGPNRMDLYSPELGAHWSGERRWKGRIELHVDGPDSCSVRGEFTIYSSTGAVLRSWEREASLAGAHDWLTDAGALQMRWRVERDLALNADVYTGANQGERQGSDLLRCHVDHYAFLPTGFDQE